MLLRLSAVLILSATLFAQSTTPNLGMTWPAHGAPNWDSNVVGNSVIVDNVFNLGGNCAFLSWDQSLKQLVCSTSIVTDTDGAVVINPVAASVHALTLNNAPFLISGNRAGGACFPSIYSIYSGFPIRIGGNVSGDIELKAADTAGSNCVTLPAATGTVALTSQTIGLNNVLLYAAGTTINDGSAHLVSAAPSGSVFHGITTLAGLAGISINGTTPFSGINAAPFTGSGSYSLTNSDVPNLDIAWLAIQAALLTGKTYIPAGTYIIGSVKALPLYIPLSDFAAGSFSGTPTSILGSGPGVTILKAGMDFGAGVPLIACGDPAGTSVNTLGRYSGNTGQCNGTISGINLRSSAASIYPSVGTTPIAMTGFAWGARLAAIDVWSQGFGQNLSIVGDHTQFIRFHSDGGTIGIEWSTPSASLFGDVTFDDLEDSGQSIASISVASGAQIAGAQFNGETYLSAPIGIRAEAGSCTNLISTASFDQLFDEFMGNGLISDESGLSGGVWTNASKCRQIIKLHINQWFQLYSNSNLWTTGGRGRRATIDAGQVNMVVDMISGAGAQIAPTSPSSGPTPLATFNVNKFSVDGNAGSYIAGDILGWRDQNTAAGLGIPLWVSAFSDAPYVNDYGIFQGPEIDMSDINGVLNGAIGFYDHNGTGVLAKLTGPDNGGTRTNPIASTNYIKAPAFRSTAAAFSTLPSCAAGTEGTMAAVTDSSTAVWGATVTGSSTNHILAYCDGTNWTVAGK